MEYSFYLFTKWGAKETLLKIYEISCQVLKKNNLKEPVLYIDTLVIGLSFFSFFFPDNPQEKIDEEFYQVLEKETKVKTNYYISIQHRNNPSDEAMIVFFQVISEILKKFEGDTLLMEIEGTIVFEKLNGQILVNGNLKDYQKEYYSKKILDFLDTPYAYDDNINIL